MRLIYEFMTRKPMTVGADQRLDVALSLMRAYDVRHLPVLDEGRLVELLSNRDIADRSHFALMAHVREQMSPGPYTVTPGTSLEEVADMFASCKFEAAVVTDGLGAVLGVFTTVDLARALLQTLRAAS